MCVEMMVGEHFVERANGECWCPLASCYQEKASEARQIALAELGAFVQAALEAATIADVEKGPEIKVVVTLRRW
jgi:hypothetical protein